MTQAEFHPALLQPDDTHFILRIINTTPVLHLISVFSHFLCLYFKLKGTKVRPECHVKREFSNNVKVCNFYDQKQSKIK